MKLDHGFQVVVAIITYIHNWIPAKSISNDIRGSLVCYTHFINRLDVFGCVAYVHMSKKIRTKLFQNMSNVYSLVIVKRLKGVCTTL